MDTISKVILQIDLPVEILMSIIWRILFEKKSYDFLWKKKNPEIDLYQLQWIQLVTLYCKLTCLQKF